MADEARLKVEAKRLTLREVKLLDVNARFMRHETFQQLVANIRNDGQLTSTPFAWWNGEQYEVLSGNHRVLAGIEAGVEDALFLVTHDSLTLEERIAIQLSHNAIEGEDDPAILKQLYEAIGKVDLREYAGLDDKTLDLLQSVQPLTLNEAGLRFANVAVVFLPDELAEAEATIAQVTTAISGMDAVWLNRMAEYDAFLDSLDIASAAHGIRNTATALMVILRTFLAHLEDLGPAMEERADNDWVPISAVLGTDRIPASTARALAKVINQRMDSGDLDARWRIVEHLL